MATVDSTSTVGLPVGCGRALTADDLLADQWKGFELIDGEPREKEMGSESEEIAMEVGHLFRDWLKGKRLGRVGNSNTGYTCFPEGSQKLRKPDTSFVRLDKLPNGRFPKGHCPVAPDLVVEVVSPNETSYDTMAKVEDFLSVGVALIWVIYPGTRTATVFRGNGTSARLTESDMLDGEDVLPGFSVLLKSVLDPEL